MRRLPLVLLAVLLVFAPACRPTTGYVDATWWLARQLDWLVYATEELSPGSMMNVLAHLEREARDPGYSVAPGQVPDDAWDDVFEKMWRLRDTSDFDALRIIDLLYSFRGHPIASEALWQKTEQAMLDFKYWYSDPTPTREFGGQPVVDDMWYWTENHILIFHTVEYLAGQMFPDRVFTVSGLTGEQHRQRVRERILKWLDERSKFGFTEWHSNVYYSLDIRPLLTLAEFADDPEIARRASMVLDLVLFDVALHLHHGTFGATHGRSYIKDKASATTENTFDVAKMLFEDSDFPYSGRGSSLGAAFARAKKYRLPEVIRRVARHDDPMIDRERMNLPIEEVPYPPADIGVVPEPDPPFGLDYRDEDNVEFWWSMGSQPVWLILPITFEIAERENLWASQFSAFKPLRDLVYNPSDPEGSVLFAQALVGALWPFINESLLTQVNTYTYRTKHYMLSTAQDYRKGVRGSQTHTSQATLAEQALVFTQHPGYLPLAAGEPIPPDWNWQREDEPGPGYWTGEASQPRAAQVENVTIAIYSPQYQQNADLGFPMRQETHAYFPHAHFDEVVQEGNWTFGRKGDAYVALYSWRATEWRDGQPEVFQNAGLPFDLVAPGGAKNVWITECGSIEEWPGGFAAFRAAIGAASVDVTETAIAFDVSYVSPTQGTLDLGWEGPLMRDGNPEALSGYPRFDNPFAQVAFPTEGAQDMVYVISDGEYGLMLDFPNDSRTVSAPPDVIGQNHTTFHEVTQDVLDYLDARF